jgi:hypothetical protein
MREAHRLGFLVFKSGEMLLNHERDGLDKRYMHTHSREQMRKALGEWAVKLNQAGENKKVY